MSLRRSPLPALLLVLACARPAPPASAPAAAVPQGTVAVDRAAMDPVVAPGDDFYLHAAGGFMKSAVIPPDRSGTGAFLRVFETVEGRNRALVEAAAKAGAPAGTVTRKVGDLYLSYMDEATIERRGLAPLRPALDRIAGLADRRALAAELGATVRADVDIMNCTWMWTSRPLGLWVEQDMQDPAHNAAYLVQGGLGLPDCSYYLDDSPRLAEGRQQYRAHLARMFLLAGFDRAEARAERVVAFETRLAATHASREDSGQVERGRNRWTRADLEARAPGLDWAAFLAAAGLDRQPGFVVWQPTAVTGLAAAAAQEPLETWRDYLAVRAVERAAPYLTRALADESFAFHGTVLSGTPEQLPRWKRGLEVVDRVIGEGLGQLYVEQYFPARSKAEILVMVENIRAAFGRRIDALHWMAPETRASARAKLAALQVGIGYPDRWRDHGGLTIAADDLFGNVERGSRFEYRRNLAKLGQAPDRGEWCFLPHEVNAVNLPVRNGIQFPAGFMEPPFFDARATPAAKYGALGAVIGHEISHSFDDQGALFDAQGRLASWWTEADLAHFQAAGLALSKQYDAYRPFPDLGVNGKLTLGENIADLAGLAAAHDAWRASLGGRDAPVVDGFTGEQQFFLAFAQTWEEKEREPSARRALMTDGHAPGHYRALTVRNLDAWYPAFGVREGQALWLAPEARVRVW
ncbi:MAG: M13 family metallopeptidase [Anaeromyxobacter sp.]